MRGPGYQIDKNLDNAPDLVRGKIRSVCLPKDQMIMKGLGDSNQRGSEQFKRGFKDQDASNVRSQSRKSNNVSRMSAKIQNGSMVGGNSRINLQNREQANMQRQSNKSMEKPKQERSFRTLDNRNLQDQSKRSNLDIERSPNITYLTQQHHQIESPQIMALGQHKFAEEFASPNCEDEENSEYSMEDAGAREEEIVHDEEEQESESEDVYEVEVCKCQENDSANNSERQDFPSSHLSQLQSQLGVVLELQSQFSSTFQANNLKNRSLSNNDNAESCNVVDEEDISPDLSPGQDFVEESHLQPQHIPISNRQQYMQPEEYEAALEESSSERSSKKQKNVDLESEKVDRVTQNSLYMKKNISMEIKPKKSLSNLDNSISSIDLKNIQTTPIQQDTRRNDPLSHQQSNNNLMISHISHFRGNQSNLNVSQSGFSENLDERYCTKCYHVIQLRARHCKICDKCVMTYDHHCIFLGTCIGLQNRMLFFVMLMLEIVYLSFSISIQMIELINIIQERDFDSQIIGIVSADIIIIIIKSPLFVMVTYLFFYQTYLISVNLTYYEYKRWKYISYLKLLTQENLRHLDSLFIQSGNCLKFWSIFLKYTFVSPPESNNVWQLQEFK